MLFRSVSQSRYLHLAYAYNVDYWDGKSQLNLAPEMLQLRYANYPKDYFMGMLPSSQYGSVAVLPSTLSPSDPSSRVYAYNVDYWSGTGSISLGTDMVQLRYANYPKDYFMGMLPSSQYGLVAFLPSVDSAAAASAVTVSSDSTGSERLARLNADLSALAIRATEYLQRWKEVVQFSSKDYSDQMAAQFGIKAPEYMGNHCHYIGGWSNVININEVVNTNLDTDSSQASIAGKGVSSQSGHAIIYDCGAEHQVIMCVYHAVPMLDWDLTGQAPQLTVTVIS